jgi:hypothetical protein
MAGILSSVSSSGGGDGIEDIVKLLGFDANNKKFISYATPNCPNIYLLVML